MEHKLTGILPAFMTAFTEDTTAIDFHKTKCLVENLKKAGVHGLYTGGTSGEMILCTAEERMQQLETIMEVRENLTILAHVGSVTTVDSVRLAKHAASVGADAIASVTPLYFKYTFEEVKQYYRRLCEAAELPMIIYSIPALTGTTLNFDQLSELLSLPGVGGMKFTSSDFWLLNRLKTAFPEKVFYNGADEMLLSGLSAGADGGIGTTYNFMPEVFMDIYNRFQAGDMAGAWEAQSVAARVIAVVLRYSSMPACKYMIHLSGLNLGICREPFQPLTDSAKADLYENAWKLIETYGR